MLTLTPQHSGDHPSSAAINGQPTFGIGYHVAKANEHIKALQRTFNELNKCAEMKKEIVASRANEVKVEAEIKDMKKALTETDKIFDLNSEISANTRAILAAKKAARLKTATSSNANPNQGNAGT